MTNINTSVSTIPTSFSSEGWHLARCIGFVQLGTIFVANTKWQPQIRITWELPMDRRAFNSTKPGELRPKHISKEYASLLYGKSHLKVHIMQWLGTDAIEEISERQKNSQGFDPFLLVGQICQIKIEHRKNPSNQKWFEDVVNVHHIRSEEVKQSFPPMISDTFVLTFEDWHASVFNALPKYVKDKIVRSKEYVQMFGSDQYSDIPPEDNGNDNPPF